MPSHKRRMISLGIGAAVAFGSSRTWAQTRPKPLRMLLNTSYSGPQAWSLLATSFGYSQMSALWRQNFMQVAPACPKSLATEAHYDQPGCQNGFAKPARSAVAFEPCAGSR